MNETISRRRHVRVLLGSLALSLVAGCATLVASRSASSDVARVRASGRLVVLAYPTAENRFLRWRPVNGPLPLLQRADLYEGVDVEILRRFAERLGVELWVQRVSAPDYGQLIPDLLAGRGDVVAGSFSITDERRRHADFSRSYFEGTAVLVVPAASRIRSLQDVHGDVGAVVAGTSHEERLLAAGIPRRQVRGVSSTWESLAALEEGETDFILMEAWQAEALPPKLRVAERLADPERYGFGLRPKSDLLPRLDALLIELEESGELAAILARNLAAGS